MPRLQYTAPQGDIEWEELHDDPATAACRELLARLDEEEEQQETIRSIHCEVIRSFGFESLHAFAARKT